MCENYLCAKPIDVSNDSCLTCNYCREPLYCSRKCQAIDWVKHDCPNAVDTMDMNAPIFVPYHYEDMLCAEEIAELDPRDPVLQSYSVRCVNADMTVQHKVVPSLVGAEAIAFFEPQETAPTGASPVDDYNLEMAKSYRIGVSFDDGQVHSVQGQIPKDLIYKGNVYNETANALAGGASVMNKGNSKWWNRQKAKLGGLRRSFSKARDSYVFWPGSNTIYNLNIEVPLSGVAKITLDVGSGTSLFVSGGYVLRRNKKRTFSKNLKGIFDTQLETKLLNVSGLDAANNLQMLRAADAEGNVVIITVLVNEGSFASGRLVDIEFIAPRSSMSPDWRKGVVDSLSDVEMEGSNIDVSSFDVDPANLEQVIGLTMGLELAMASDPDIAAALDKDAGVIRKYARERSEDPDAPISPYVSVSIANAVDVLHTHYESVDRLFGRKTRKFFRGMSGSERTVRDAKKFTTKEEFQALFDNQLDLAEAEQDSHRSGESFLENAEAIASLAKQRTKKHAAFSLQDTNDRYRLLTDRMYEIKREKKDRHKMRKGGGE